MTFPLGRFGDNHVIPDMLFDPRDPSARAPEDALDVQFRCPVSLNVMLNGMAQAGREDFLDQWRAMYAEVAEETARFVQRDCGWVTDRERSGEAPARLEITAVMHRDVPGFDVARWHLHVYVGATGVSLLDDRRLPVPYESIQLGVNTSAHARHIRMLRDIVARRWDVRWARPRPGAVQEIVEPPWHEYIETPDRGVCPGPEPWGPRRLLLADQDTLELAARSEASMARAEAEGRGYRRPKLMFEDDEEPLPTS